MASYFLNPSSPPEHGIPTLLLLTDEPPEQDAEPWRAEPSGALEDIVPRSQSRVLLAEDDPMVAALVERLLGEAGYQVVSARHGAEALRIGLSGGADLLVTDVRMPQMDGWELSRRLRAQWPDLPVLFISGYDTELSQGIARPGLGAFLRKPFEPDELLRQVTRLLRQ